MVLNDKKDFYDRKKKNTDEKIDLRSGVPRLIIQNSDKYEGKNQSRKITNSVITINDVKSN